MNLIAKLSIISSLLAAILASLTFFFEFDVVSRQPGETFTVMRGQNAFQIANDLKAEGYINSKLFFLGKVIMGGHLRELKAGEYDFKNSGTNEIISKLVFAKTVASDITIIPGWDIRDIAISLGKGNKISSANFYAAVAADAVVNLKKKHQFLGSIPADKDLEGFLAPDTYQLSAQSDAVSFVEMALDNFDKRLTSQMRRDIELQGRTVFEIVTMAAILEKEVKTLEDKKMVAGILWKRLGAGMPLQVDSTLLYYKVPGADSGIDKEINSPYNTYRFAGLPAGPICNPGTESIEAAIYPVKSDYWYYLSTKDGTTVFSRSYGEHLINKAKYLDNI